MDCESGHSLSPNGNLKRNFPWKHPNPGQRRDRFSWCWEQEKGVDWRSSSCCRRFCVIALVGVEGVLKTTSHSAFLFQLRKLCRILKYLQVFFFFWNECLFVQHLLLWIQYSATPNYSGLLSCYWQWLLFLNSGTQWEDRPEEICCICLTCFSLIFAYGNDFFKVKSLWSFRW